VLTSGHIEISRRRSNTGGDATEPTADTGTKGKRGPRLLRFAAALFGLLGALLAIVMVLLLALGRSETGGSPPVRRGGAAPAKASAK